MKYIQLPKYVCVSMYMCLDATQYYIFIYFFKGIVAESNNFLFKGYSDDP